MHRDDILRLLGDMNWGNPEVVQSAAVAELAAHLDDEDLTLVATQSEQCPKACWQNAALVLQSIGYPRIKSVVPILLEWFRDVNWPGVRTMVSLLKTVEAPLLVSRIEEMSKRVVSENDDGWAWGLMFLMRELGIEAGDFVDEETYHQLHRLSQSE
ncbi:MAG: DUF5071 domain-containing protein [Bacteroidota bacterium]